MKLIGGPLDGNTVEVEPSRSIPIGFHGQPSAIVSPDEANYWPSYDYSFGFYHRAMRDRFERSLRWRAWKVSIERGYILTGFGVSFYESGSI